MRKGFFLVIFEGEISRVSSLPYPMSTLLADANAVQDALAVTIAQLKIDAENQQTLNHLWLNRKKGDGAVRPPNRGPADAVETFESVVVEFNVSTSDIRYYEREGYPGHFTPEGMREILMRLVSSQARLYKIWKLPLPEVHQRLLGRPAVEAPKAPAKRRKHTNAAPDLEVMTRDEAAAYLDSLKVFSHIDAITQGDVVLYADPALFGAGVGEVEAALEGVLTAPTVVSIDGKMDVSFHPIGEQVAIARFTR